MQSSSQMVTTNKPTRNASHAGCPSCRPINSVRALTRSRRIQTDTTELNYCTKRYTATHTHSRPSCSGQRCVSTSTRCTCYTSTFTQFREATILNINTIDSCVCKLIYFVTLPATDVFILTRVSIRVSDCMCVWTAVFHRLFVS